MGSIVAENEDEAKRILPLAGVIASELCDACLGRQFGRVPPLEPNAIRGGRLRSQLATQAPRECAMCEDLLGRVPRWLELCLAAANEHEYSSFLVGCVLFDEVKAREEAVHARLLAADTTGFGATIEARGNSPSWRPGEWLKTEINRELGRGIEAATGKKVDFDRPEMTFRVDTRFDHVELQPADLFARGRYRKLVRDLPQTRWPCRACNGLGCRQCAGKGKTYEASVEELVAAPVVTASGAEAEAFHGMGREDIDARSLGSGRPFILELKRPRRRSLDWARLEGEINRANVGRVEVEGLAPAGPADAARYKAADPAKTYHAVCTPERSLDRPTLESAVEKLAGVGLEQRTPQRVAHRRSDLVRKRKILGLRVLAFDPERFTLEIRAESGTYIKEFVSGDEGRTQPSLSQTLGVLTRVTELDVVDVAWTEEASVAREA